MSDTCVGYAYPAEPYGFSEALCVGRLWGCGGTSASAVPYSSL
ncbi:hypothetical protein [uncultured Ruminococcus sp.]|nr:hypothetical protein [uncultured Ruminococcus sp.]